MLRILSPHCTGFTFVELTGEAYATITGTELILRNLKLLGIRKKKEIASEAIPKMLERFNSVAGNRDD